MERNYYFFIAIALTMAVLIGSLISIETVIELPPVRFFDKFFHVAAYFLLTLSWLLANKKNLKQLKSSAFISLLIFIFGIVIEVLQGVLTNYRQADLFDMVANLGGIVIAFLFFKLIFKRN